MPTKNNVLNKLNRKLEKLQIEYEHMVELHAIAEHKLDELGTELKEKTETFNKILVLWRKWDNTEISDVEFWKDFTLIMRDYEK
jgi:hypothetical protein